MKYVIVLAMFSSITAVALPCEAKPKSCPLPKSKSAKVITKEVIKKEVIKVSAPNVSVYPNIVVKVPKPSQPVVDKCCEANKGNTETNVSNYNKNNFSINVGDTQSKSQNPVRIRLIERVRIKTERVIIPISNPNRILFLAGIAKTQAVAEVDSCCTATAVSKHQVDLGAMYVRDISSLSLGLAITMRQGFYLAAGLNF